MDLTQELEPLLSAGEVASVLKISRSGLERLLAVNAGPAFIRIGKLRRWRKSDLKRWIDDQARSIPNVTTPPSVNQP